MSDKTVIGVDPVNGRSKLVYIDHAGPASYATGGEAWPQQSAYGGPNSIGLNDIAWCNGGVTEDGLYYVVPVFGGSGALKATIKLKWFSITAGTGGTFTGTPATLSLPIGAGAATDPVGTSGSSGTVTLGNGTGACTVNLNSYTPAGTISGGSGSALVEVSPGTNLSGSYLRLAVLGG
jgi:hypothetical protein